MTPSAHAQGDRFFERRSFLISATILVSCAYFAGINPYFLPNTYDNIVYSFGALSIVRGDGFRFGGSFIWDWGPATSVLIAPAAHFGGIAASKATLALTVPATIWAGTKLFRAWEFPHPSLCFVATFCLPSAFAQGTRIMAESPYLLTSTLALLALHRLQEQPSLRALAWAVLATVSAIFFRHAGLTIVVAGAVVGVHGIARKRMSKKAAISLLVASGSASMIFAGWKAWLLWLTPQNELLVRYQSGFSFLLSPDPLELFYSFVDLFLLSSAWPSLFKPAAGIGIAAGFALLVLVGFNLLRRLGTKGPDLATTYVIFNVLLLLFLDWKHTRYFLPIAPYLIAWLIEGARRINTRLPARYGQLARKSCFALATLWFGLMLAFNGTRLFVGNLDSHGPLLWFASDSPSAFYRGEWQRLALACEDPRLRQTESPVLVSGRADLKYPAWLCERPIWHAANQVENRKRCLEGRYPRFEEGLSLRPPDARFCSPRCEIVAPRYSVSCPPDIAAGSRR